MLLSVVLPSHTPYPMLWLVASSVLLLPKLPSKSSRQTMQQC